MEVKTATEASKMLEAALQQMDGIISSASVNSLNKQCGGVSSLPHAKQIQNMSSVSIKTENGSANVLNERSIISAENVLSTAKTLALALQQVSISIIFYKIKKVCSIQCLLFQFIGNTSYYLNFYEPKGRFLILIMFTYC